MDSPPTSITVAPCWIRVSAWAHAASYEWCFPPSEKESGVVFRIPMMSVFLRVERIYCDISNGRGCVSFKDSVVAIPWDDNVIRLVLLQGGVRCCGRCG